MEKAMYVWVEAGTTSLVCLAKYKLMDLDFVPSRMKPPYSTTRRMVL
jgi:hypothetical protein